MTDCCISSVSPKMQLVDEKAYAFASVNQKKIRALNKVEAKQISIYKNRNQTIAIDLEQVLMTSVIIFGFKNMFSL